MPALPGTTNDGRSCNPDQGGIGGSGSAPVPAMDDLTRNVEQITYAGNTASAADTQLPLEAPLHIEVNGRHLATLMRLPGNPVIHSVCRMRNERNSGSQASSRYTDLRPRYSLVFFRCAC